MLTCLLLTPQGNSLCRDLMPVVQSLSTPAVPTVLPCGQEVTALMHPTVQEVI